MKSKTLTVFVVAAFAAVTAGYAQFSGRLKADIPFEFHVGNSVLPAGEYEIVPNAVPRTLLIRSEDSKAAVVTLPDPVEKLQAPQDSKLVFSRYGNTYFLSQVWRAGSESGYQMPKSKSERELARNVSGNELVSVALTMR